ncbi:MAG: CHASE2 domain-containing protein [bacterium]
MFILQKIRNYLEPKLKKEDFDDDIFKDKDTAENVTEVRVMYDLAIEIFATILIGAAAFFFFKTSDDQIYDWQLQTRNSRWIAPLFAPDKTEDIIIVYITDQIIREIEQQEEHPSKSNQHSTTEVKVTIRTYLAKLIEHISKANPRLIAVDIPLKTFRKKYEDKILQAVLNRNKVIISSDLVDPGIGRFSETSFLDYFLSRTETAGSKTGGKGYGNLPFANPRDGIVREEALMTKTGETTGFSFALAVFARNDSNLRKDDKLFDYPPDLIRRLTDTYVSRDEDDFYDPLMINYVGPPGIFQPIYADSLFSVEAALAEHAPIDAKKFEDKIVLIGRIDHQADYKSLYMTPYTTPPPLSKAVLSKMGRTELHANIINMLIQDDYIQSTPAIVEVLMLIFLFCLIVYFTWHYNLFTCVRLIIALLSGWWLISFVVFICCDLRVPVVGPSIVILFAPLFGIIICLKAKREYLLWGPKKSENC